MGEAFLFLSGGDSNSSASSVTGFRFVVVGASLLEDGIEGHKCRQQRVWKSIHSPIKIFWPERNLESARMSAIKTLAALLEENKPLLTLLPNNRVL